MKIAFFELEGWESAMIKKAFPEHELFFSPISANDYFGPEVDFDAISIFVNSKIDKATLQKFPHLRFLTARCTGYDHIDLTACKERGITVSFVPGYGDNTVAEFAFGLLLNLTRKIYGAINQVKETASFDFKRFRGIDLKGKTIGIIGTGRIGKEAIAIAKGFGLNVLAFDLLPNETYAATAGIRYVPLDTLLQQSDFISLHAPYTKETHHLINMENIVQVKHGAYLINTARGGLVETDALIYALQNGILAGAGLDVLEEEGETKDEMKFLQSRNHDEHVLKTVLENHVLIRMENVLITPHNAFNSQEALQRILQTTLKNIEGFAKGAPVNTIACSQEKTIH